MWTTGTTDYAAVGQTYPGVGITGIFGNESSAELPATGTGIGYQPASNVMFGVTTDPTKSGMVAKSNSITKTSQSYKFCIKY